MDQISKIIELAKKTGDRLIIYDSARPERTIVVMDLAQYEKLLSARQDVRDLTDDELIDKINGDISLWKSQQLNRERGENNYKNTQFQANKFRAEANRRREADSYFDVSDGDEDYGEDEYEDDYSFDPPRRDKTDYVTEKVGRMMEGKNGANAGNRRNAWSIPEQRKKAAEEVIEEDRQYLEEIPF